MVDHPVGSTTSKLHARFRVLFESLGRLRNFWHVIAVSSELKLAQQLKRPVYGRPLLLWRDSQGQVYAIDDCCAHRRAPLEVKDYQKSQIVCPYHGWTYQADGRLVKVPSDLKAAEKLKCQVPVYTVMESQGFIWIYLSPLAAEGLPPGPPQILEEMDLYRDWTTVYKQKEFATSEELLVDNFMDPTHTGLVHDGLIRSSEKIETYQLMVETHDRGVAVHYQEQEEQVGLGSRLLFGKSMRTKHCDEFLLPNLVRVTYVINDRTRFMALIACTPLDALDGGRTLAMMQLRFDFGWFNKIAKPIVSRLADKVLAQDHAITAAQYANMRAFPERREHWIGADAVAIRVAKLRKQMVQEQEASTSSQSIELRF